ncbi:Crp/Fnr family transcriptional regulator [Alteribacillus iranensis]|uniref:cAMP-binding domain of CRP or a regulatory subunit of cAMP-dependent protein kinases n=1 Tax=Alteribacillus iranensis TaxID=930128 RepID=A0A1I2EA27_9BACI|nr:Crp/Fnr family transcriptional regulator [Alteribacillus iranensis]SFE89537.1 cAMP-binding domain of CRP or a regulatory subunit of cAMP-dependent protein kinases [Alteribacillus iranensis]
MNTPTFTWRNVKHYGQRLTIPKKEIIYHQGEEGKGFYFLEEGEVKISIIRDDGYERIIDYVTPEQLIGEQGISNDSYVTTAETITDSVLYYFTKNKFHQLCKEVPEAAEAFSISFITKIRLLVDAQSLLDAPVDVQLAHYLLLLCQKHNSFWIEINKTAMSRYLGKSRVTIWKILKQWEKKDIIRLQDHFVHLKDVAALRDFLM